MDIQVTPEAQALAVRPYSVIINEEQTQSGVTVFIATNPDLPGCVGQGKTPQEAIQDLALARADFIQTMLDDEVDVPAPDEMVVATGLTKIEMNLSSGTLRAWTMPTRSWPYSVAHVESLGVGLRDYTALIRRIREKQGWTQENLAEVLGVPSGRPVQVSRWETGKSRPGYQYAKMLLALAGELGIEDANGESEADPLVPRQSRSSAVSKPQ